MTSTRKAKALTLPPVAIVLMTLVLFSSGCKEQKRSLALGKVKAAARLATTEVRMTKMVFATQKLEFLGIIPVNEAYFAARTQATVKAGIDLDEIKPEDIDIDHNKISVQLPPVRVVDFIYPFDKYEIDYSITSNAFANTISLEKHEELYRKAELEIRRLLPHMGIREAAERNTRQMMEKLLANLGFTEIYVTFKTGDFIEQVPISAQELKLTSQ
ncbi:MAG TPA: DUF4230 domain-containing protein [Chryseosolibacter sp.]|nr:DUF4230 domain-containing protein [Chryseosolibacter sp.]